MSFLNKVILVTGASSGIGAATALKFTAEGAKVAIVGRNEAKLKNVCDKCEQSGGKPLKIVADVTNDDNAKRIVSDTINQFGKLDVLVNNAGMNNVTSILAGNAMQVFDQVMATNIRSIVCLTNLAAPHLVANKGNIINISSVTSTAIFAAPGFAYNTSKAALDHFTRSVALELAVKGVRVNAVNPGPVKTDIIRNSGLNEAQEAKWWDLAKKITALDRVSDPEEVADLIMYLASDKARSITGASFVIDNGNLLKR